MGLGMQIAYHGFAGSAQLEAEAAIQLIRLDRFSASLASCYLAIEAVKSYDGRLSRYDVRLDLITRDKQLYPLPHAADVNPVAAIRRAFDTAVLTLEGSLAA